MRIRFAAISARGVGMQDRLAALFEERRLRHDVMIEFKQQQAAFRSVSALGRYGPDFSYPEYRFRGGEWVDDIELQDRYGRPPKPPQGSRTGDPNETDEDGDNFADAETNALPRDGNTFLPSFPGEPLCTIS